LEFTSDLPDSPTQIQQATSSTNVEQHLSTDIPTQFNLPSKKPLLTREQVKAFYQADLFVPGIFDNNLFLILGLILPIMDYATDYYYAGPDSNI